MGITRTSEWERVRAQERGDAGYGDDQADDDYHADPDAANYAAGNDPETAWRDQGRRDSPNRVGYLDTTDQDETGGELWGRHQPRRRSGPALPRRRGPAARRR